MLQVIPLGGEGGEGGASVPAANYDMVNDRTNSNSSKLAASVMVVG